MQNAAPPPYFQRKLDRIAPWLLAALTAGYLLSFPLHRSPIIAVIPVAAAGLFYGRRGGWIAGTAAILINAPLFDAYREPIPWNRLLDFERENFFLLGHFFTLLIGAGAGYLRETAERYAQTESALRASEESFRSLYENAAIGIYSVTPEGRIALANPALVKMLGYESFEELARRNLEKEGFAPESPRSKFLEAMEKEGFVNGFEAVWLRKDGSTFYARESAKAIRDERGNILRFEGTVEDITEKKRAEEELQEREARLKNILETATDAIITLDESQRILSFSKSAEDIFGYSAEEVLNKPLDVLMPEQYAEAHQRHVRNFNERGQTSIKKGERRPILGRRKDGSEFPAEASISKFESGGKTVFVAFLRDVSERVQKEKESRARARFFSLLNDLTGKIIAAKDFSEAAKSLTEDITALFEADSCYVTRWDAARERTFPVAANEALSQPYETLIHEKGKKSLSLSALEAGRLIVAEDYRSSPHASPEIARQFPIESALCIPLIYGGKRLGAVVVGYRKRRSFTPEELARAEQVGSQISLAAWNLQQEAELQRSLREEKALAEIVQALSEGERLGLDNVLGLIVGAARDLIPKAEQAVIHLLDEEEGILTSLAVDGFFDDPEGGKRNIRLGEGVAGQVILRGEAINIANVATDPRFLKLKGAEPSYRSLMVAPVRSGEKNLGTISVQSGETDAFSANDMRLLSQLGAQAALAIENANLLESTRQALREVNALYRINQGLAASLETDALMQDTVELLQKSFDYYYVQIYVVEPESGDFVMRAGSGEIGKQLKSMGHRLAAGQGIVGATAETGAPFFTNNVDDMVAFVRNPLLPETKSELAAPVKIGENIIGLLDVHQRRTKPLTQRDIQLVTAVADQLAIALQKADLYESLQTALQQEKAIRNQMTQNERLTVMGRLLATIAHELNNPLQAIQNALFLLKEERGISPQGRQDLEIVLAESERMGNLIERLRATYRPSQSEEFQLTQLNDIVEDVRALISTHLRHSQITFEFQPDPDLPRIPALSDQIRQVVLNLFMNACEAMPGGGTLSVSTRLLADSNEAALLVTDTGAGIPEDLLPVVFEAFITNKPTGTGLGLTISRDIVLKHRGRIAAQNNPQGGATFAVWLPLENGEIA